MNTPIRVGQEVIWIFGSDTDGTRRVRRGVVTAVDGTHANLKTHKGRVFGIPTSVLQPVREETDESAPHQKQHRYPAG